MFNLLVDLIGWFWIGVLFYHLIGILLMTLVLLNEFYQDLKRNKRYYKGSWEYFKDYYGWGKFNYIGVFVMIIAGWIGFAYWVYIDNYDGRW